MSTCSLYTQMQVAHASCVTQLIPRTKVAWWTICNKILLCFSRQISSSAKGRLIVIIMPDHHDRKSVELVNLYQLMIQCVSADGCELLSLTHPHQKFIYRKV